MKTLSRPTTVHTGMLRSHHILEFAWVALLLLLAAVAPAEGQKSLSTPTPTPTDMDGQERATLDRVLRKLDEIMQTYSTNFTNSTNSTDYPPPSPPSSTSPPSPPPSLDPPTPTPPPSPAPPTPTPPPSPAPPTPTPPPSPAPPTPTPPPSPAPPTPTPPSPPLPPVGTPSTGYLPVASSMQVTAEACQAAQQNEGPFIQAIKEQTAAAWNLTPMGAASPISAEDVIDVKNTYNCGGTGKLRSLLRRLQSGTSIATTLTISWRLTPDTMPDQVAANAQALQSKITESYKETSNGGSRLFADYGAAVAQGAVQDVAVEEIRADQITTGGQAVPPSPPATAAAVPENQPPPPEQQEEDVDNSLALGLGIGLGVGIPVVACVVIAIVMTSKRRNSQKVYPSGHDHGGEDKS